MIKLGDEFTFIGTPIKVWKDTYDVSGMVSMFADSHPGKRVKIQMSVEEK